MAGPERVPISTPAMTAEIVGSRPLHTSSAPLSGRRAGFIAVVLAVACVGTAAAEEESPEVSSVNVGISVMLLGSIGFMMALFELTHCPREAMQKNTWKALSATISIFSAVLIFQGVNGLVEAYILEGSSERFELYVNAAHAMLWFISLQLVLAILTGVMKVPGFNPRMDDPEKMETRLKTFAILLGHITGFAAINAFSELQQQVPRTVGLDLAIAPISWLSLYLLQRLTDFAREGHIMKDGDRNANEELWDDVTEETEDDVVSLAASFCFVQAMRFLIGGTLPNAEGEEPEDVITHHKQWQCIALCSLGLGLGILEALRVLFVKWNGLKRLTRQGKNVIGMTFSWCIFYGMDWHLSSTIFVTEQGMMKSVVLALIVTIVAFFMIFGLMHAEESERTSEQMDEAIRAVVNAIGILIGFAWEKTFDVAVAEITETTHFLPAPVTKLVLAIGLAGTVVPAWYRHILPTILMFEKAEEEAEHVEAVEAGTAEASDHFSSPSKAESFAEGSMNSLGARNPARTSKKEGSLRNMNVLNVPLLAAQREEAELRAACEEYKKKIQELKGEAVRADNLARKNRELEETLTCISRELHELQGLADQLHGMG